MANHQYTSDIVNDVLFRSDELTNGSSDYEAQALIYVNRAYRSLYMGGTEFDTKRNEPWWWLYQEANLVLQPPLTSGTISVTNNSASVTFSANITPDLTDGWYMKIDGEADVYKFSVHGGTQNSATLDSVYTGDTDTAASYRLMKLEYDLQSDTLALASTMRSYQDSRYNIYSSSIDKMLQEYPLNLISSGVPTRFSQITETRVQFNRYGHLNGDYIRVDYGYWQRPDDLTDSGSEEPLVPRQYRHVLADMAVYFLHKDKENDRATDAYALAKRGIEAMISENRVRYVQTGRAGHIYPRSITQSSKGPLRTETGLVIG